MTYRILVIEDNTDLAKVLQMHLQELVYQVFHLTLNKHIPLRFIEFFKAPPPLLHNLASRINEPTEMMVPECAG